MWRNFTINDTYEPGSTFKIFTSAMGLEENVVSENSQFNCSGGKVVAGRTIKCWRSPRSHGTENFVQGFKIHAIQFLWRWQNVLVLVNFTTI